MKALILLIWMIFIVRGEDDPHIRDCFVTTDSVDCSGLNILAIPKDIFLKNSYSSINFRLNNISEITERTFFSANGVQTLDLSFNRISFVAPSCLVGLESLTRLMLPNNRLESIPMKFLDGVRQLTYLDLSHNFLKILLRDMFEPTKYLQELKLSSNPLEVLDPSVFEYLGNLEKLMLENTHLKSLPSNVFDFNPLLTNLDLSHNLFQDIPKANFPELRSLEFSYNHVNYLTSNSFTKLPNLSMLYLNNQHGLKAIFEYAFTNLEQLRVLHCSYNKDLTYINSLAFMINSTGKPLHLDQLHLKNNALKRLDHTLLVWQKILYMDLRGNPWKCDCHMRWMYDLHIRQNFQENLRCRYPKRFRNLLLSEISSEDMICGPRLMPIILIVLGITLILLCSILVTFVFYNTFSKRNHRYSKITAKKDRIELEWDNTAEP